ncbi:hypothetical protein ACEQ8H_008623 [Pleosporales sp. CAS-2024a]
MAELPLDYYQLYLAAEQARKEEQRIREEEQRRREAAEQAQMEEQRRREEEQRMREAAEQAQMEEQRRREAAEKKIRMTNLPEYLDACHKYLYSGLTVQTNTELTTQGNPANATDKLRPDDIVLWDDFPAEQQAIWDVLMKSDFTSKRQLASLNELEGSGKTIQEKWMSSELDLHHFQASTVNEPVASIIKQLYRQPALRRKFGLKGSVQFENHANTLSPETDLSVPGAQRRSPRLQARAQDNSATPRVGPTPPPRPRADQFCVYNTNSQHIETRIPVYITEYKAPHKVSLGCIYEGLEDMKLRHVVTCRSTDTPRHHFRRLMAAIITQAFSYMVQLGVAYGCVCTGQAFIFLHIPDDPKTVYYFLSVPSGDVGEATGWDPGNSGGRLGRC